jgi:outer membrane protein OmpA-like peptidoglycan-associated protein
VVKRMLVDGGVAADRIEAEGYGQERPLADNDTDAGRARNRRLELVVTHR